jgi:hypothetical protein
MTTTGTCFRLHIDERVRKAMAAMTTIKSPQKLSLKTALALFDLKVAPTASYGLQIVWRHLRLSDIKSLERTKTTFLKRALGAHRSAKNRLVYALAACTSFVEELRLRLHLEETEAYKKFVSEREAKQRDRSELLRHTGHD